MANVLVQDSSLQAIANAIRAKNGESTLYKPGEMAAAITAIPTGGGSGEGGYTIDDVKYYTYANGNNISSYTCPADFNENSTILLWFGSELVDNVNKGYFGGLLPTYLFFGNNNQAQQRGGFFTREDNNPSVPNPNAFTSANGYGISDPVAAGMLSPEFFMKNGLDYDPATNKIIKVEAKDSPNTRAEYTGRGGFEMLYIP